MTMLVVITLASYVYVATTIIYTGTARDIAIMYVG